MKSETKFGHIYRNHGINKLVELAGAEVDYYKRLVYNARLCIYNDKQIETMMANEEAYFANPEKRIEPKQELTDDEYILEFHSKKPTRKIPGYVVVKTERSSSPYSFESGWTYVTIEEYNRMKQKEIDDFLKTSHIKKPTKKFPGMKLIDYTAHTGTGEFKTEWKYVTDAEYDKIMKEHFDEKVNAFYVNKPDPIPGYRIVEVISYNRGTEKYGYGPDNIVKDYKYEKID